MRELYEGLRRRIDGQCHAIAQRPVVTTTIPREGGPDERPPKHDGYRVDE